MEFKTPALSYDFRIGVTGHREFQDDAAIAVAVRKVIGDLERAFEAPLQSKCFVERLDRLLVALTVPFFRLLTHRRDRPATEPMPTISVRWTCVTSLAKGADRIVAAEVLKQTGSRLEVIIPLSVDDYRQDFETADDLADFNFLHARADAVETASQSDESSPNRPTAYRRAGESVVKKSDVLIAVWDGEKVRGTGGTAEIIAFAIEERVPVIWIDAVHPTEPARLLGIPPHAAPEEPAGAEASHRFPYLSDPVPIDTKRLVPACHRLQAFLSDNSVASDKLKASRDRLVHQLATQARFAGLPETALRPAIEYLIPIHVKADELARYYHALYDFAAASLFGLAACAVVAAAFQAVLLPGWNVLSVMEITAMVAALILLRVSRKEAWHEKWLNDRHLAEWMRSTIFTTLVRPPDPGPQTIISQLPFYPRLGLEVARILSDVSRQAASQVPQLELLALRRFIGAAWVGDQARWHHDNAKRKHQIAHRRHTQCALLFTATLVMASLHLAGVGHGSQAAVARAPASASGQILRDSDHGPQSPSTWSDAMHGPAPPIAAVITLLTIILPSIGSAIHAIGGLLEDDRIAARSAGMARNLRQLASRYEAATSIEELRALVAETQHQMLAEHEEWSMSLRFRELVLPA